MSDSEKSDGVKKFDTTGQANGDVAETAIASASDCISDDEEVMRTGWCSRTIQTCTHAMCRVIDAGQVLQSKTQLPYSTASRGRQNRRMISFLQCAELLSCMLYGDTRNVYSLLD